MSLYIVAATLLTLIYFSFVIYLIFSLILQDLEENVFADLLDELTLGFCFEIHRSCKMGQLFLDETDEPSLKVLKFQIYAQKII